MNIPTLKLPQENHPVGEVFAKSENGVEGFGKALRGIIEEQDKRSFDVSFRKGSSPWDQAEAACKKINEHHQKTRRLIDEKMQRYLVQHDGEVVYWHDSVSGTSVSWDSIASEPVTFDYFGDEYEISGPREAPFVRRKSQEFIYRNTYKADDSPLYKRAVNTEKKLKAGIEGGNPFLNFVICIGFTLLFFVLCFPLAADIAELIKPGLAENVLWPWFSSLAAKPGEGILQTILEKAFFYLMWPARDLAQTLPDLNHQVGNLVAIAAVSIIPAVIGCSLEWCVVRDWSTRWKHHRFINSKEYKEALQQNSSWREQDQALSDEWHQAWFDWVKANKHYAGESAEDALKQEIMDAQDRQTRADIKKQMGIDIPEGIRAADWMRRFNKGLKEKTAELGAEKYGELPPKDVVRVMHEVIGEMMEEGLI